MHRPCIRASVSVEFQTAIDQYCLDHDLVKAEETRRMWARRIGKRKYLKDKKLGRPVSAIDTIKTSR